MIAVTSTVFAGEDYRMPHVMLGVPYIAAVERAGAAAILLSPAHQDDSIREILDRVHGLVLTGGDDVAPARYGQEPHPRLGSTSPARDAMEFLALEEALRRRMPVLAICRGMQVLNVAFGGTLYQDIASQLGGELLHEQSAAFNERWHRARVEEGSGLERIFGATELFINSFHHQAVDRVGEGLRATAWAEDGLVEGVEAEEYPWVFGVQWHPERGEADLPGDARDPDRRLFWEFVQEATRYADGGLTIED